MGERQRSWEHSFACAWHDGEPCTCKDASDRPLTTGEGNTAPQWDACDRCTQGVMDAGNVHTTGSCKCECHAGGATAARAALGVEGPAG